MARPTIGGTDLRDAPTTPMRIIMGIVAAFVYVMVLIGCMVAQIDVSISLATLIGGFILMQEGLDVTQWGIKRATDNEYVRAKSGTPAVAVTAEHATVSGASVSAVSAITPAHSERGDE